MTVICVESWSSVYLPSVTTLPCIPSSFFARLSSINNNFVLRVPYRLLFTQLSITEIGNNSGTTTSFLSVRGPRDGLLSYLPTLAGIGRRVGREVLVVFKNDQPYDSLAVEVGWFYGIWNCC